MRSGGGISNGLRVSGAISDTDSFDDGAGVWVLRRAGMDCQSCKPIDRRRCSWRGRDGLMLADHYGKMYKNCGGSLWNDFARHDRVNGGNIRILDYRRSSTYGVPEQKICARYV